MNKDPHAPPPDGARAVYKLYQRKDVAGLDEDSEVYDFHRGLSRTQQSQIDPAAPVAEGSPVRRCIYTLADVPGLRYAPSLLPPSVQWAVVSRLLHRDLSSPQYNNNVRLHHRISSDSSSSFFSVPEADRVFHEPLLPEQHQPLSHAAFLRRKLRWFTLGAQYDWTSKQYPQTADVSVPPVPRDISELVSSLFPLRPEAAIVNVYTPGNTLSLHRDVSEACDAGLVSVSFGCDAMMVMTGAENDAKNTVAVLRLKSGDVLFMDGPARWAWHGIPHVLPGTCPEYLKNWPARSELAGEVSATEEDPYRPWRAWMADKRINLNVRQVWPSPVSQAGSESTTDGTVPC